MQQCKMSHCLGEPSFKTVGAGSGEESGVSLGFLGFQPFVERMFLEAAKMGQIHLSAKGGMARNCPESN